LRGALYPNGEPQERALNMIPMLARQGPTLFDGMRQAARQHAETLVG
jgi:bacillithiol synthase